MNEEKILVGMCRPGWEEFIAGVNGYLVCSCRVILSSIQETRKHWQDGHFDYPVYATKEELLKAMSEKLAGKETI